MRTILLPVSWKNTKLHQTGAEHRRLLSCALQSILEQKPMGPVISVTLLTALLEREGKSPHQTRQTEHKQTLASDCPLLTNLMQGSQGLVNLEFLQLFLAIRVCQDMCWKLQIEN